MKGNLTIKTKKIFALSILLGNSFSSFASDLNTYLSSDEIKELKTQIAKEIIMATNNVNNSKEYTVFDYNELKALLKKRSEPDFEYNPNFLNHGKNAPYHSAGTWAEYCDGNTTGIDCENSLVSPSDIYSTPINPIERLDHNIMGNNSF